MCILHCCRTPWVKCVLFFGCDFLPYVLVLDPNAWSFTLFLFLHWTADSNVILCRDVLAVLKCAVSIHIFPLDAASVLLTYRKHGQALLYMIFTCMIYLWLYRPYYTYYYYYHKVLHTDILIFSNKDCSFLPNLQCAFCWLPCVLPSSSLCAVTETSPHYLCSHSSAVFSTLFTSGCQFSLEWDKQPIHLHTCMLYCITTCRYLISEPPFHDLKEDFWTVRVQFASENYNC